MSGVSVMDKRLVCLINHYITGEHQVHGFREGVQSIVSERGWCTGSEHPGGSAGRLSGCPVNRDERVSQAAGARVSR